MLRAKGATDAQLSAKTVKMLEEILAETSEAEIKNMGAQEAVKVKNELESLLKIISDHAFNISSTRTYLELTIRDANEKAKELKDMIEYVDSYAKYVPDASNAVKGVSTYAGVLKATKEVFGENLSDEVMSKAIEAASYVAWRDIMGESREPKQCKRI